MHHTKSCHEIAPLPYAYDALTPCISEETLILHHDKLYSGAVRSLNEALTCYPQYCCCSVKHLLCNCCQLPFCLQTPVRHYAGSIYSHELYFDGMTPSPSCKMPIGCLADAINRCFGCFDHFWDVFRCIALAHFGSGWAWLAVNCSGALQIVTTPNMDTPLCQGLRPILTVDLWEHAYYLDYSARSDYLESWRQVIDWNFAEENFKCC